jgi:ADP-ribose pyrophosphatase YjhB (NUDIX family)
MPSYFRDSRAPAPNGPRTVGVTAVIEREGRFLVDRRADDEANTWAFIGGRLGEEETLLEALHREVREETGLAIADAVLFGLFSDPTRIVAYPDGNVRRLTTVVFRVTPAGDADPVPSEESKELRFVTAGELEQLEFWPAHESLRAALLAGRTSVVVE